MTDRCVILCWNPQQARHVISKLLWPWLTVSLSAGNRMVIECRPESKTRDAEKKYHAMIGEISKQAQHMGAKWQPEDWKRLLLDKFARDTGRSHGSVIPNLDSSGVVEVGILSRKFNRQDASDFIAFLNAWGDEHGIHFKGDYMLDPETDEVLLCDQ